MGANHGDPGSAAGRGRRRAGGVAPLVPASIAAQRINPGAAADTVIVAQNGGMAL